MQKWFIGLLFVLSTGFFMYQHSTGYSWDFSVYSMNSRYFLTGNGFFEWGRPPLASVLMFFGDYFYIALVSFIGLFASIKFSEVYGIKSEIFYSLVLSPYVVVSGFSVGTEYLVLSLTLLFFAYLKDELAGFFLGLAALTHYSSAVNGVFLLFSGKKLFKALLLAFLLNLPWLLFNFSVSGDPLYSFLNQYLLDVAFRGKYLVTSPELVHFLIVGSFLTIFFILGLFTFNYKREIDWLMLAFFGLRISSYFFIPLKEARYLFPALIPMIYFSARLLDHFNYRASFIVVTLTLLFIPLYYFPLEDEGKYFRARALINDSCMVKSNSWVFLNYFGLRASPYPRAEFVDDFLNEGYTLIFFKHVWDPPYVFNESFMSQFFVVNETNEFIILNNESVCAPPFDLNTSFIEEVNNTYVQLYNETFDYSTWDLISGKKV